MIKISSGFVIKTYEDYSKFDEENNNVIGSNFDKLKVKCNGCGRICRFGYVGISNANNKPRETICMKCNSIDLELTKKSKKYFAALLI